MRKPTRRCTRPQSAPYPCCSCEETASYWSRRPCGWARSRRNWPTNWLLNRNAAFMQIVLGLLSIKCHKLCLISRLSCKLWLTLNRGIIFSYDADVKHAPCLKSGHRAHWALIVGYLIDDQDKVSEHMNILNIQT